MVKDYAGRAAEVWETVERGHGRGATRRYRTLGNPGGASRAPLGKAMYVIAMVESRREVAGKVSTQVRFHMGSTGPGARRLARALRGHRGIENDLHWGLDAAFREDDARIRDRPAVPSGGALRGPAPHRLDAVEARPTTHGRNQEQTPARGLGRRRSGGLDSSRARSEAQSRFIGRGEYS